MQQVPSAAQHGGRRLDTLENLLEGHHVERMDLP
jgi:hypothetical protein